MDRKLEALKEAVNYLEIFIEKVDEVIKNIQDGNEKEVFSTVVQMTDGIEWLLNIFRLTEDIQINKMGYNDVSCIIGNFVEALENRDFILLQDVMEYELRDQLLEWKRCLNVTIDYYSK